MPMSYSSSSAGSTMAQRATIFAGASVFLSAVTSLFTARPIIVACWKCMIFLTIMQFEQLDVGSLLPSKVSCVATGITSVNGATKENSCRRKVNNSSPISSPANIHESIAGFKTRLIVDGFSVK